MINATCIVT